MSVGAGLKAALADAVRSWRPEMAELVRGLVSLQTENPPGRCYGECVTFIEASLRQIGLSPKVVGQTVLASHGHGPGVLYFHGHYDVVPVSDREQFEPREQDGLLYGRGTADMKGGLASMAYAVRALKECGVPLSGRVGLVMVPDEETGGERGSRALGRSGQLGQDAVGMLTAEPTSGVVWNASRGAISLSVEVRGRAAHVGLQHEGINAFEHMVRTAVGLLDLKREVEQRQTSFSIQPAEARRSILLLGGRSEGGTGFNVVPAECRFTIDRRVNPEEDFEQEKGRLLSFFDQLRAEGVDLEVQVLQEGRASGTPADHPLAQALSASVADVTGELPRVEMCPGLLETRFYAERGVPALAYGPGLLAVSHGPDEFVDLDDVERCAVVYALTAARMLSR